MEFFKHEAHYNFLGLRRMSALLSAAMVIFSGLALLAFGIHWGLDFTGGVVVEVGFPDVVSLSDVRVKLEEAGFDGAVVQNFGAASEVIIRLPADDLDLDQQVALEVAEALQTLQGEVELKRIEAMGAQVGQELADQGSLAILVALAGTIVYIALRFEYRLALAAALALAHDPILILGVFSAFQIEFDLATLAAILAVMGYSLNDTIVVFDRVKENFLSMPEASPDDVVNRALNQTLSRTLMTSGLTLLVVLALLFFGGPTIFGFSLALCIGIVVGTYSSIYVASMVALKLGTTHQDFLPKQVSEELP